MSEEILYIDDGELVYYINENEFITCDEIPYPMLEGIKHLQQKVEQLEKENDDLKNRLDNEVAENNLRLKEVEQLENIRKEAIKFILQNCEIIRHEEENVDEVGRVNGADLLNILNKGSEK